LLSLFLDVSARIPSCRSRQLERFFSAFGCFHTHGFGITINLMESALGHTEHGLSNIIDLFRRFFCPFDRIVHDDMIALFQSAIAVLRGPLCAVRPMDSRALYEFKNMRTAIRRFYGHRFRAAVESRIPSVPPENAKDFFGPT